MEFLYELPGPTVGAFVSFPKKLTNARQLPGRGKEHACSFGHFDEFIFSSRVKGRGFHVEGRGYHVEGNFVFNFFL